MPQPNNGRTGSNDWRNERRDWRSSERTMDRDREMSDRDRDDEYRFRRDDETYRGDIDNRNLQQRTEPTRYGTYGMRYDEGMPSGHRGKGPRNFARTDERIRELVCERLSDDDRIDASNIDVDVRDGEVILRGSVDDRRAKRMAEDVIENIPGVKDVQNKIRLRKGSSEVDQMNSFLRGEISAVETYRMALDKLDRNSTIRNELETCKRSHEDRVNILRDQVTRHHGTPVTSSGPWGVFARIVEGGARVFGDKAAIMALEEGEDHGLRDYKDELEHLNPEVMEVVRSRLLPAQEETHARMSSLKRRMQS